MINLHIITACSRPFDLVLSAADVAHRACAGYWFRIRWHIAFQNHTQPDPHGAVKDNEMMDLIPAEDWIWILDDDNRLHPDFFPALWNAWKEYPEKDAIVFSQNRKDKLGPVLRCGPENMIPGRVDTAQVVFRKSLIGVDRMPEQNKMCDGYFYEKLYQKYPSAFAFVDLPVTNFNWGK